MRGRLALTLGPLVALAIAAPAQGADYVGLGDSYSSGTGTAGSYSDNCERTASAYPAVVGQQLEQQGLVSSSVNLSCSGARTQHITTQAQTPGNAVPQVQIPGGLGPDTDYVTLQIGGNDAGFVDVLTACANPFTNCNARIEQAKAEANATLPPKLAATYDAVRAAAPNAIIAVVGYPRIFRPNQSCNVVFTTAKVNELNAAADWLDGLIRTAAQSKGLAYVNAIPAFTGHGACDSVEWINGFGISPVQNSYHPNVAGSGSGFAPVARAGLLNVPDTTLSSTPPNPSNSTGPSFQFTGSATATGFQCRLDGGAFAACSSPRQYAGVGEGSHSFQVRAVNAAGNVDQTPAAHTWTVDTTPPAVTIDPGSGPTGTVGSDQAGFEFSTNDPGATLECRLDEGAFGACSSPQAYSDLADGPHTFTVRATDPAGNTGSAGRGWTVDTIPPHADVTSGPADPARSADAELAFTVDDPTASVVCRLDGVEIEPCASPQQLTGLDEGPHLFEVWAIDAAGNEGPIASHAWTVDLTGPMAQIDTQPDDPTSDDGAVFEFSATDNQSDPSDLAFECELDGGGFNPCSSGNDLGPVGEGAHTFRVRATDEAGNAGPEASYGWTVDQTGPAVSITSGPSGLTGDSSAEVGFTVDGDPVTVECDLDGAGFEPCTSPKIYSGLSDGGHTLTVRGTDAAGNEGTDSRTWTVDQTEPETAITAQPADPTNASAAAFEFDGTDNHSDPGNLAFECELDGGGFNPCDSGDDLGPVGEGGHAFKVRAIDEAANADGSPAVYTWTVDLTAPDTMITSVPPNPTGSTTATFDFASTEDGAGFECSLDGAPLAACTPPVVHSGLAAGDHIFEVRAVDLAGNVGGPATHAWRIAPPGGGDGGEVVPAPAGGGEVAPAVAKKRKCKKGRKLVKRKGKHRCVKKKRKRR